MARTVIITGGAAGIGAEIARKLAGEGYNIVIVDLEGSPDGIVDECKALGAPGVLKLHADVSNYEACGEVVRQTVDTFGGIWALINNAGITRDGLLMRMSEAQFDSVINVNLKSVYNMSRHAVPVMVKAKEGRIINMSSIAGVYGNAGQTNYSASKAAIIGFTKSLAKEIGSRGITVNAIAPGFIETAMTKDLPESVKASANEKIALKHYGQVSDIANAVSFLAGDGAGYITAHVLNIDGGLTL